MSPQQINVIVIGGTCGSGKTTIGKELAKMIGYEFIDGDDFHTEESKAKMGRGEPLTGLHPSWQITSLPPHSLDKDRIPWLESLSNLSRKENSYRKLVIACSALKRKYRSILLNAGPDESKKIIMLKVPAEILKARVDKRKNHYAKSSLIDSQLEALELPSDGCYEPNLTVIDGTKSVEEILTEIMEQLPLESQKL